MDENKKLSSEEQREKMKQEYLQELKLRKQILDKMKEANKMNKISENLEQVFKLAQISKNIDEFINKLNSSDQVEEAKLDMSLENSQQTVKNRSSDEILNQIKLEMGLLDQKIQQEIPDIQFTKTILDEEKLPYDTPADKKFMTKTLGDEEH